VSALAAAHFGGDQFEFEFGFGHVLMASYQRPAELQRFGHHLAQGADLDPHDIDLPTGGMRFDHPGDGVTQR